MCFVLSEDSPPSVVDSMTVLLMPLLCALKHQWAYTCLSVLLFADFALKLILNAITTGANIIKGRVYGNTMINLTVANSKVCVVMCCVLHGESAYGIYGGACQVLVECLFML